MCELLHTSPRGTRIFKADRPYAASLITAESTGAAANLRTLGAGKATTTQVSGIAGSRTQVPLRNCFPQFVPTIAFRPFV